MLPFVGSIFETVVFMRSHLLYMFFALTVFLQGMSCTKPKEQLPPETQAGKFMIGFKVNGKVYTSSGKGGGFVSFGHVGYTIERIDSSISVTASKIAGADKFDLWFRIKYSSGPGTYFLQDRDYQGMFSLGGNPPNSPSDFYTTTSTKLGRVNIKYFNGRFMPYNPGTVLAGTFEMTVVNPNGTVINITEGRFDIGN